MTGRLLPPGDLYLVPEHQVGIRKIAAMAVDARRLGLGGVKRPPFPTEDSKQMAGGLLHQTQRVGAAGPTATVGLLKKPGPSIKDVAVHVR
jgi:hypothetical protein